MTWQATPNEGGIVDQAIRDEVVRRMVEAVAPEMIVLFGSAARGTMNRHSDLDLLVVKADVHRRNTALEVRRSLRDVDAAFDVVVVTPEDVERHKDCQALVIKPALREGKVLYGAA